MQRLLKNLSDRGTGRESGAQKEKKKKEKKGVAGGDSSWMLTFQGQPRRLPQRERENSTVLFFYYQVLVTVV